MKIKWRNLFKLRHFLYKFQSSSPLHKYPSYSEFKVGFLWLGRNYEPEKVSDRITLHHSHFDHVGIAPFLKQQWPYGRHHTHEVTVFIEDQ